MNKQKMLLLGAACICSLSFISQSATAAVMYDQLVTPDVIFGSGNANGSFTVDKSDEVKNGVSNGVELGLRGKLRFDATGQPQNIFNSNGDGTYSFDAGVAPNQPSLTAAVWSFEWSINSEYNCAPAGGFCRNLNELTYLLGMDSDPTLGTDFLMFDPINLAFADHAIGDNTTANGGGTEAADATDYASLIENNHVAQNSWQPSWFLSGFDPTVDGQYDFFLEAYAKGGTSPLARTDISIIVGAGATVPPVPVPAAIWLFGTAMIGLVGFGKRRKAAS